MPGIQKTKSYKKKPVRFLSSALNMRTVEKFKVVSRNHKKTNKMTINVAKYFFYATSNEAEYLHINMTIRTNILILLPNNRKKTEKRWTNMSVLPSILCKNGINSTIPYPIDVIIL